MTEPAPFALPTMGVVFDPGPADLVGIRLVEDGAVVGQLVVTSRQAAALAEALRAMGRRKGPQPVLAWSNPAAPLRNVAAPAACPIWTVTAA